MHFFSNFETASQDILGKVGQEAVSKCGEKGAKSGRSEYWDRFIVDLRFAKLDFNGSQSKILTNTNRSPKRRDSAP